MIWITVKSQKTNKLVYDKIFTKPPAGVRLEDLCHAIMEYAEHEGFVEKAEPVAVDVNLLTNNKFVNHSTYQF